MRILEFDVLVTHQGPSRQVLLVELQGSLEVSDGSNVVGPERVVVANETADFRPVLVELGVALRQLRQLCFFLHDVENVAVGVEVVQTVRVDESQVVKDLFGDVEFAQVVVDERALALKVRAVREEIQEVVDAILQHVCSGMNLEDGVDGEDVGHERRLGQQLVHCGKFLRALDQLSDLGPTGPVVGVGDDAEDELADGF